MKLNRVKERREATEVDLSGTLFADACLSGSVFDGMTIERIPVTEFFAADSAARKAEDAA